MKPIEWVHQSEMGKPLSVRFRKQDIEQIRAIAQEYGIKDSTVVRRIVENYFDNLAEEK